MTSSATTEQIRHATDITALVSDYVKLRPAGPGRLAGLCPFHKEKTPSFTVNVPRQRVHCFGCGVDGDCFSFYQRIEQVNFPTALQRLADRAGVTLTRDDPADKQAARRQRIYAEQIGREAAAWWTVQQRQRLRLESAAYAQRLRAEKWFSRHGADTTAPSADYAWFWFCNGERIAEMWREEVDAIESAGPLGLVQSYEALTRERPSLRAAVQRQMAREAADKQEIADIWAEMAARLRRESTN